MPYADPIKAADCKRRWKAANREKTAAYYKDNRAEIRTKQSEYGRNNRPAISRQQAAWVERNRDHVKTWRKRRHAERTNSNAGYAERERQKANRYYRGHLDECRRKSRELAKRKRLERREYERKSYRDNPEIFRQKVRRRRARKLNAVGSHTLTQWMARVEYYGWRCKYCKCELTIRTLTKDHRIALSKGGSEWAANTVPACRPCNSRKGAR